MTSPTSTIKQPDNELLSDEELEKRIYDITQTMLVTLSEWQAGVTIDYHTAKQKGRAELFELVKTQKQLHANMVIGEDDKLVIPDYPAKDDEGEPLYSKRAAKEGRKQVTARYHARGELRAEQRQRNSNHVQ